jgi:hypothetical protein
MYPFENPFIYPIRPKIEGKKYTHAHENEYKVINQ